MEQPKPAKSREKPVVNRRWLLGGGYFLTSTNGVVVAPSARFALVRANVRTFEIRAICVQKCVQKWQSGRGAPDRANR